MTAMDIKVEPTKKEHDARFDGLLNTIIQMAEVLVVIGTIAVAKWIWSLS